MGKFASRFSEALLGRPKRWAYLFATLLTGIIWFITISQLNLAREMHMQSTEKNLLSVTRALHAHATKTLELADQAVMVILNEYKRKGLDLELATLVQETALKKDIFNLFSVVDKFGSIVLSTQPFVRIDIADRSHFKTHSTVDTGRLEIGEPVVGRVTGKVSINISRRINGEDDGFAGVVVVSMDPFYFTDVYGSLGLSDESVISLIREDGLVLVRRTDGQQAVSVDISETDILERVKSGEGPILDSSSPVDHVHRLWAYQQLDNLPLYVSVGVSIDQEIKPYLELRSQVYLLAALLTIIIYGFAYSIGRFVEKLNKSRRTAVDANQAKSEFLSNVSHELRSPLNGILGYAELLELKETDKEKISFIRYIHQSGEHLLSLVNSLLSLNRIEKGQIETSMTQEPIRDLIQEVLDAHAHSAKEKGLALSQFIDVSVPQTILCDRVKLLQILHNLIQNAVKFTSRGSVHVDARARGNTLEIIVADTGCGISEAHQKVVFDRFFQARADTPVADGLGIGLSIAQQMAYLLKGKITVESRLGVGSTFTLRLPLDASMQSGPANNGQSQTESLGVD